MTDYGDIFAVCGVDQAVLKRAAKMIDPKTDGNLVPVFFDYNGSHWDSEGSFWDYFLVPDNLLPFFPRTIVWIDEKDMNRPLLSFRRLGVKILDDGEFIPLEKWF